MDPPEFDGEGTCEEDGLTALEFSPEGNFLATGDRNGKIAILHMEESRNKAVQTLENWLPLCQFQSHEPEFDFLKSLEIEGKINQIKFLKSNGLTNCLLSTNDKTIKLWKFGPKRKYICNAVDNYKTIRRINLPTEEDSPSVQSVQPSLKRTFANAHSYHVNSLALNSDGETFISADDLRINVWRLESNQTTFNLVDIKPDNMEELTEVITAVQCHPQHCNILIYSSSRGVIKVCDTRVSAVCSNHSKMYVEPPPPQPTHTKSFITDILNSISDISFSSDGRYILSRDYMSVKIWDVNMESKPVKTILLHEYLKPVLYDLYTADIIFDKFEVSCSPDGRSFASGSYGNQLKVYHSDQRGLRSVELPRVITPEGEPLSPNIDLEGKLDSLRIRANNNRHHQDLNYDEKVLLTAWHPSNNTIAVAGKSGLCLYKA